MKSFLTKATAALAVAGALVATAPAQAWPGGYGGYYGYNGGYNHDWSRGHRRYHHDDDAGLAIGAGIIGLALGAAIASDHSRNDGRYYSYDRGYYQGYRNDGGYGAYYDYDDDYPGYGYYGY